MPSRRNIGQLMSASTEVVDTIEMPTPMSTRSL
jgi:hypothetical protein